MPYLLLPDQTYEIQNNYDINLKCLNILLYQSKSTENVDSHPNRYGNLKRNDNR